MRDAAATRVALLHTEPATPRRAETLAPLLLGMLAKEPARRTRPDAVRRGLYEVWAPGTGRGIDAEDHASGAEWEQPHVPGASDDPVPSFAHNPFEGGGDFAPDRPRPAWRPDRLRAWTRRRRPVTAVLVVVAVVCVIGLVAWLIPGGSRTADEAKPAPGTPTASPTPKPAPTAASSPAPTPTGGAHYPYGPKIGLTRPLALGTCLDAAWSGKPLLDEPYLKVVDCAKDAVTAQVVATASFPDAATARAKADGECAKRAGGLAKSLAYAGTFAVVPTEGGFAAAKGTVACLVAATHSAFYGEIGRFRDSGIDLYLEQMSIGDCFVYKRKKDANEARLVDSCARSHTDQVIGFVEAPQGMDLATVNDKVGDMCDDRFAANWSSGGDMKIWGWVLSSDQWNDGFRKVVCTVSAANRKPATQKAVPVGSVQDVAAARPTADPGQRRHGGSLR
ncbi:septum formation family protein [Streptomyces sp. NPDC017056]|uniref:septum formation family protein n=1 Tax=Streptomyces sp. NPDC017056 TaxID=3364973 RepID=UPI00379EB039